MHSQVTAHLKTRSDLLLSGQLDKLLDSYVFPLPLFLPTQRMVLHGREEARAVLSVLLRSLLHGGVVALQPQVSAVELPREGRYRIWVDWQEMVMPSAEMRLSQAIYYCRTTDLGPRVEMVNFTRLSMPDLHHKFEALALSA